MRSVPTPSLPHGHPGGWASGAGLGSPGAMFVFFSNRLGCLGSLAVSAVLTVVLILLLSR